MTTEIPKRPEILDSLNYVAHVEAVARVAVEALCEIMEQRYNNAAWLRGRAGRAIVKIVNSGWKP